MVHEVLRLMLSFNLKLRVLAIWFNAEESYLQFMFPWLLNRILFYHTIIEYEIIGEGSQISTNQKPGNSAFSLRPAGETAFHKGE